MSLNIGLNVRETDGLATPSIQGAATSVVGLIIRSERGIPGKVYGITNGTQFVEHFGSYIAGAFGAYAIKGFFDNGGTTAYITRVINTVEGGATAPELISTIVGPWSVPQGPDNKLTITTDLSATPVDVVFNGASASLDGGSGTFDLSGQNGILTLKVNDAVQTTYTFVAADFANGLATATVTEVAAALNREFPGIQVWVDSGKLKVRTDRKGNTASLEASGSACAALGLSTTKATGSGNVPDIDAVTLDQAVQVIGDALRSNNGKLIVSADEDKQAIVIKHPNTGSTATLQIAATSAAVAAVFGFATALQTGQGSDPSLAAVASTATLGTALTVQAGYRGTADKGKWGDQITVEVRKNPENPASEFDLIVYRRGVNTAVETWSALDMTSVQATVNDPIAGSKFIYISAVTGTTNPAPVKQQLQGGKDGSFADKSAELNAFIAAIDLFKLVDIQLLACPELIGDSTLNAAAPDELFVSAALTHCINMQDRMFVGHTPPVFDVTAAKAYGKIFQGSKVYGALYFPWISVADPLSNQIWIPPTGHILGVYARTALERGIWKAPAGNEAIVNGALDIRFNITDDDHTDLVKNGSVNAVRYISGQGIIIDSSRTLSTDTLWLYVNVRLLFNFVKSSLKGGLRWVVQEPNTSTLWNKIKYNSVTPFLMGLWRRGAFGPGSPDQVFTVKIDDENNPPDQIKLGYLNVDIYFYPSRPAETIVITVGQQEGAATATESQS